MLHSYQLRGDLRGGRLSQTSDAHRLRLGLPALLCFCSFAALMALAFSACLFLFPPFFSSARLRASEVAAAAARRVARRPLGCVGFCGRLIGLRCLGAALVFRQLAAPPLGFSTGGAAVGGEASVDGCSATATGEVKAADGESKFSCTPSKTGC